MAQTRFEEIKGNTERVLANIAAACARAGRSPADVRLLAVTKYSSAQDIALLLSTGLIERVGESRVQDVQAKWQSPLLAPLREKVSLHFIGHLQLNKAAKAAALCDCIDSVDSVKTAQTLARKAAEAGKTLPVLIQVKLTESSTQSGASLDEAPRIVSAVSAMQNITACGYMAIAPAAVDAGQLRSVFGKVRERFLRDFTGCPVKPILSLGMSGDYEIAVEEGSTLPRIGSALFAAGQK